MLAALRGRFPGVVFAPADDPDTLAREAVDAEVFYGFVFPPLLLPQARALRWVQSISAGVEGQLSELVRQRDLLVTNGAGIAADAIAEHVIATILALCRNLHVGLRLQAQRRWDRPAMMGGTGLPVREFSGSRVAVLGLGPIGRAVASRAVALGATVRGLRRHGPEVTPSPPFEAVLGPGQLGDLLAWADFVVLAVPHTPETDGLMDAAALARMRPEACLVNVARGSVVDETALIEALRRRAIAGAALDVFVDEPLPPESPFWELDSVLVTPHIAGATPHYFNRSLELFMDNLDRYLGGKRLRNLVDKKLGYPTGGT
jgi:phosphoglycerate dehydrogenase-like enzyme